MSDHQSSPSALPVDPAAEDAFARALAARLDHGAANLRQGVVNRLATARREALESWRPAPVPVWGLAWAGGLGARIATNRYFDARMLAPLVLLFLALAGAGYWQLTTNDLADIDAALLASDLPIDAYLDQGFDQWLKRPAH